MSRIFAFLCATVAALALLSSIGMASATAATPTALCKSPQTSGHCPAAELYPVGSEFHLANATGTEVLWSAGAEFLQSNCTGASMLATITSEPSNITHEEAVKTQNSALSFTGCNRQTKVKKSGIFTIELSSLGKESGVGKVVWREFEWEVKAGVTCIFGGEISGGVTLESGTSGTMVFKNATLPKTGGSIFCPSSSTMNATFTVLSPIYVLYPPKI